MTLVEGRPVDEANQFDRLIMEERRHKRLRDRWLVGLIAVAVLCAFLGLWEAVHATGLIKPIFVSDPGHVARSFGVLVTTPETWADIWSTFEASIIGLALGAALGIGCGIIFGRVPVLRRAMSPYLTLFNALPRPALAPIFILWFGLGELPKIAVAVSIVFFVLLINTMAGLSSIDADIAFLGRSLGMTRGQRFFMVELPHATPAIVAGLRLGAVYSVLGVVVSEIVAANHGLGQLLVKYTNEFDIASSFAVLAMMALLATLLDLAVWVIQKRLSWSEEAGGR